MPHNTVNGMQMYYELHGQEGKEVVLFLHGLGSSTQDWELQTPYFTREYRVLLVDIRGHGRSGKPAGPYSVRQFAQDMVTLLDQLKIDKAHTVGLSMGGMIAFQMAADYPDRLLTMTIANSGPAVVARTLKEKFAIWMRFFIVRLLGMQKMGETLAKRLFVRPEEEALRQTFIKRWTENDPRAYMDAMRGIVGWTVEDQIGNINVPTLVLASDQDYTPVAAKEAYVVKMPNATLKILPDSHHAVAAERPEVFNEAVYGFIHSVIAPAR
ncbi:MAG: alpha/beta hydrolase [Anaerolineae bacterium]|nr:alpha/beta hydrolase [Anaerolineae bacterium]